MTNKNKDCTTLSVAADFELNKITMFPNPTYGILNITNFLENNFIDLAVFDLNGKLQMSSKLSSKVKEQQFDFSSLRSGMYLVVLTTKKTNKAIPIMKL